MDTSKRLIVFLLAVNVCLLLSPNSQAATVHPPLIDEDNLTLRYAFEENYDLKGIYSFEDSNSLNEWTQQSVTPGSSSAELIRSSLWSTDGSYSVKLVIDDTDNTNEAYNEMKILPNNAVVKYLKFDYNITNVTPSGGLYVSVNGSVIYSIPTPSIGSANITIDGSVYSLKFGVYSDVADTGNTTAFIDNITFYFQINDSANSYNGYARPYIESPWNYKRFGYALDLRNGHLNFTYDASTMQGTVVAWTSSDGSTWSFENWSSISACPYVTINGDIATLSGAIFDEFRIYNTTLTSSQITDMQEALRVRTLDEINQTVVDDVECRIQIGSAEYDVLYDDVAKDCIIFHDNLTTYGEYTLFVDNATYSGNVERKYYVTLTDEQTVEFTAYLIPDDDSSNIVFYTVKDAVALPDVRLKIEKLINGSYVTVFEYSTDNTGHLVIPLKAYDFYRYTASKSGYDTVTGIIEVAFTTYTINFGKETGAGLYYAPHYVTLRVRTYLNSPVSGVNVTIYLNNTELESGTTDSNGDYVAWLDKYQKYTITLVKSSENINEEYTLYPYESIYVFFVRAKWAVWEHENVTPTEELRIFVTTNEVNDTHAYIYINYTDNMSQTISVKIYTNKTLGWNEQTMVNYTNFSVSSFNTQILVDDYKGKEYRITLYINHSTFGEVKRTFAVKFPGLRVDIGLPYSFYPFLSCFLMFFVGAIFTKRSAEQGALIVCMMGWIFYGFEWFDSFFRYTGSESSFVIALFLATFVSLFTLFASKGKEEGIS
jgi:hypothetical protein